jgi:hypothetical protein
MSKEIYYCHKRPIIVKRDLLVSKVIEEGCTILAFDTGV